LFDCDLNQKRVCGSPVSIERTMLFAIGNPSKGLRELA